MRPQLQHHQKPVLTPNDVLVSLKQWYRGRNSPSPLAHLYLYELARREPNASDRFCNNCILEQALTCLGESHVDAAMLLRERFLDQKKVRTVAYQRNVAESTLYEQQKLAIEQLTTVILAMEETALAQRLSTLDRHLSDQTPPRLIGIDAHLDKLTPQLANDGPPWIVAIEGIGGIGKTALTHALVRYAFKHDLSWTNFAWVTARRSELALSGQLMELDAPALSVAGMIEQFFEILLPDQPCPVSFEDGAAQDMLRARLKAGKYLIIVDNLETVHDVTALMSILHSWCGPTKIILASRECLFDERNVYHYPLPEMGADNALLLIRLEAETSNLPHVSAADDSELYPLYEAVGGNPLALRLVACQLHSYGLNEILTNIRQGVGCNIENLYTHIYRQAWERLSEIERQILIGMVLVSDGGETLDEIESIVDIDRKQLHRALGGLVRLNLVDSQARLTSRRYSIHNLTRSFLRRQVIDWR